MAKKKKLHMRSNVLSGTEDAMLDFPPPSLRDARGITLDDGDGDEEHPSRASA